MATMNKGYCCVNFFKASRQYQISTKLKMLVAPPFMMLVCKINNENAKDPQKASNQSVIFTSKSPVSVNRVWWSVIISLS